MKLFLTSMAISDNQRSSFMELVGKSKPEDIYIALIENAADGEDGDKKWVEDNRARIMSHKFNVEVIDLNNYRDDERDLMSDLEKFNVVWLGGGNTFYLRWLLKETGADEVIQTMVKKGLVYGGGSAGAVVAGPTIEHFQPADNPSKAPELILGGLGLTNIVVVPHWSNEKYGDVMVGVKSELEANGFQVVAITDEEALVVNGHEHKTV